MLLLSIESEFVFTVSLFKVIKKLASKFPGHYLYWNKKLLTG